MKKRGAWFGGGNEAKLDNPIQTLVSTAKFRAKAKGIPFDLTHHDLVVPTECPYLKTPFVRGTMYAMSLDRIVPEKGYVKEMSKLFPEKQTP